MDELKPDEDQIKEVYTDKDGRVETIIFKDGNKLLFKDFIDLMKMYLRTIVAGEVISWDDVWRFQRLTDARGIEGYLDNVEQEGILKGSRFQLTRSQKMSIGVMIILVLIIGLVFVMVASVLG
jgi:hypothetical protein